MLNYTGTKRINRLMVAIISVILILVTTISYIAVTDVYAVSDHSVKADKAYSTTASSYIVMSGSTSEKVVERHSDRKMQPGKITMLMTAMVLLDNIYDDSELNNTVEVGEIIAEFGNNFLLGESITVGDLLNAMLVGGDVQAAELLAKYGASSRKIFVKEMNSKCMELGIMDTQFVNASGVYDINQYSTAADLAVITQAAMRYQKIKDALSLDTVTVKAGIKKQEPREIEFVSTNPLLTGDENTAYEFNKGGIMGVVGEPATGAQFAAAATKDDMQLIVVLMDSDPATAAVEAKSLLEYGDTKVTKNTIIKKNKLCGYARVRNGATTRVAAYTETKGFAYVPPEGSDALIQTQTFMFNDIEAPLKKGDKVGEFRIYVADELKGTVDLIIKHDVPVGWYLSKYYISNKATVILCVLSGLLLIFLLRVGHVKRRRARRREALRRAKIRELARMQMEMDADRIRRDWNSTGYDPIAPRTTDLRREAVSEALEEEKGRRRRRRNKQ